MMKTRYLMIVILTIQHFIAYSQIFEEKDSLQLKMNNIIDGQWADIDHDGLLNYVALFEKADSVEVGYFTIENDLIDYSTIFTRKGVYAQFDMVDLTQDGLLDIVLSQKETDKNSLEIYVNNGLFDFQTAIIKIDSVYTHRLLSFDINRNGTREIVTIAENISGEVMPRIYTFREKTMKWDTLSIAFSKDLNYQEVLNIDVDKDGWDDMLIAGTDSEGQSVIEFYKNNEGKLEISENNFDYPAVLKISKADLDADGDFEVIYFGKVDGTPSLYYDDNDGGVFSKADFGVDPDHVLQFFAADFNSDGFSDFILKSKTADEEVNQVMLNDGEMNFTAEEVVLSDYQDFGDWEWDGDLDIIQFRKNEDAIKVILLENTTLDKNMGPGTPLQSLAFPQDKKVTISWDSVQDDHTHQAAITYDLYIKKEEVAVSPGFDIEETHRIVVAHGNQSTLTTSGYYELESGVYDYGIQAVDNAFYAGGGSGNCHRGQFVICEDILTHDYVVCGSEEVVLVAEVGKKGHWYSSTNGDLGITDSLKITITENEDIYFAVQNSLACEDQEVWSFEVMEGGNIDLLPDIWACEGEILAFEVGDFWQSTQWGSSKVGDLGNGGSITYEVAQDDSISVSLVSDQGCIFEDQFLVSISTPELILNGEVFKILKGKSVQLEASGGANYEWSPPEGLSDHLIANPVASPEKTTTYNIELTDSIGCKTSGAVQIIVESNAFIPNLFTPNEDQRNDVLKIYGLEEVSDFTFIIYNRSGALVYESSDINEVVNSGWDGTKNGKKQPNGVYYWKVSGTYKNGNPVYLNGESSGAVHLLR